VILNTVRQSTPKRGRSHRSNMINLLIAHIYLSKLVDYVGECLETGSELLLIYMKGYN
jgi:hypothetical protein